MCFPSSLHHRFHSLCRKLQVVAVHFLVRTLCVRHSHSFLFGCWPLSEYFRFPPSTRAKAAKERLAQQRREVQNAIDTAARNAESDLKGDQHFVVAKKTNLCPLQSESCL